MCKCLSKCLNRSCQRQQLTYYYIQSLRESAIRTFNHQNENTYHSHLLTVARMKIGNDETEEEDTMDTEYKYDKPDNTVDSTLAGGTLGSSVIAPTDASIISDYQQHTPVTSRELEKGISNDKSLTTRESNNKGLNFMQSLFSIPSFENLYYLPEVSRNTTLKNGNNYNQRGAKSEEDKNIHNKLPLSKLQLIVYGILHSVGYLIFVVTGFAIYEYGGSSTMGSFILCGISIIVTALCLSEFSCRIPMLENNIYKYIYVTNGEIIAFLVGINSILNSLILNTISCIIFSGYFQSFLKSINLLTQRNINNDKSLQILFGKRFNSFINIHIIPAIIALIIITVFVRTRSRGNYLYSKNVKYRFLCSGVAIIFLISFIIIAGIILYLDDHDEQHIFEILTKPCNYTTFPGINSTKECPSNADNSFFPYGIRGFFAASAINLLCFDGIFSLSKLTNYTAKPQKNIKYAIVGTTSIMTIIYVFVVYSLLILIPFQAVNTSSTYSSVFTLLDQWYFDAIFSIGAMLTIVFFKIINTARAPATIHQLSNDGLIFSCFSKLSDTDEMPMRAIIFFGILCVVSAGVFDMRLLFELGAMMNLVTNILICGSILILRYSHEIHEKYHKRLKEQESEQSFHDKRKKLRENYNGYNNGYNGFKSVGGLDENKEDEENKYPDDTNNNTYDYDMANVSNMSPNEENMDMIDYQIYRMTKKAEKAKEWQHTSITLLVWAYIIVTSIICFLLFYYDELRSFQLNVHTFITVILVITLIYFSGVFIYIHHTLNWKKWVSPLENNKKPIFLTPLFPYLPLAGIIINCIMITSIELIVSKYLFMVYGGSIVLYYIYGFYMSKLYQNTKKRYLLDGVEARYRFASMSSVLGRNDNNQSVPTGNAENDSKYDPD